MKKTYTVKLTFSGTTVPVLTQKQIRDLLSNAILDWLTSTVESRLRDETQLLMLHKVQVTAEEIDTE